MKIYGVMVVQILLLQLTAREKRLYSQIRGNEKSKEHLPVEDDGRVERG